MGIDNPSSVSKAPEGGHSFRSNNITWLSTKEGNHKEASLTASEPVSSVVDILGAPPRTWTHSWKAAAQRAVLPFPAPVLLWDLKIVFSLFLLWYAQMQKKKRVTSIYWNYCLTLSSLNSFLTQKVLCRLLFWASFPMWKLLRIAWGSLEEWTNSFRSVA